MLFSSLASASLLCCSLTLAAVAPLLESSQHRVLQRADPPCTVTATFPPPPGYHCNMKGVLQRAVTPLLPAFSSNSNNCAETCVTAQRCISFGFNTKTNKCTLYGTTLDAQGFKASKASPIVYANHHCYSLSCTICPRGETYCPGTGCTNLQTDDSNCGACGDAVPKGDTCCGGTATDTTSDDSNCGTCGNVCTGTCSGGSCVSSQFQLIASNSGTSADGTSALSDSNGNSYVLFGYSAFTTAYFTVVEQTGQLLYLLGSDGTGSPSDYSTQVVYGATYDTYDGNASFPLNINPASEVSDSSQYLLCSNPTDGSSLSCSFTAGGASYNTFVITNEFVSFGDGYALALSDSTTGPETITPIDLTIQY